jgi:hypothetical protein
MPKSIMLGPNSPNSEMGYPMRQVHGDGIVRSAELSALANQIREMERSATTDVARAHYASVATNYERQAELQRAFEKAEHKEG